MAAITGFPSSLILRVCRETSTPRCILSSSSLSSTSAFQSLHLRRRNAVSAIAEGETLIPKEAAAEGVEAETPQAEQPVSIPVSPSDLLAMFFHAEGMMDELAVPPVIKALEEQEGVGDVVVRISEGIARIELTKQTTVQATGVASSLVEIVQGLGFKLQSLNLSFEDEEDAAN